MQARGGDDLGLGRPRSSLSARSVTPKLDASLGAASGRADGAADETSRAQRAVELLEKKQAARAAPGERALVVDAEIVARRLHARNKPRSSAVARRQGMCAHNAREDSANGLGC